MTSEHVILSIPYSGCRTLEQHLGIIAPGKRWHFGGLGHMEMVQQPHYVTHIPVRHPLDVAASWASRPNGMPVERLLEQYDAMFEYLWCFSPELYRMEDLPRLVGMNEREPGDHAERVQAYRDAVTMNVIRPQREFFEGYYEDLSRGTDQLH
jgi:hypothetical protein